MKRFTVLCLLSIALGLGSVAWGQQTQSGQPAAQAAINAVITLPLDGTWICKDQFIGCCPAFYPDTYTFNSADPVSLNVTDNYVVTDACDVYDGGSLLFSTPLLPDWQALSYPSPFTSPPFTTDPNVAWANPLFSKGWKTVTAGAHTISIQATQVPAGFSDSTVCIRARAVPRCDIKPGSDPNAINPGAMGVIPVALLGSANVNVTSVDVTSLTFAGAKPAHDLTDPLVYAEHLQDVNGDGYMDLVSHYLTQLTNIKAGDTSACIAGTILGVPFACCDAIKTPPK